MRSFAKWRAASRELAEVVQVAGPRVAVAAAVAAGFVVAPILLRLAFLLPGSAS
jgi:hypothetical protein